MAGGVQDVDAEALVLELHDGRGDRNASLLFDLHPVRYGGAGIFLALDRARLRDGPAVEQEFFCQGGFTGVGVRDDRKGSAPGDFFFQGCHVCSSRSCFFKSKQRRCYMGHPPNLSVFFIFVITGLVYHMRSPFTSAHTAFSAKMGRIPKSSPFRGTGSVQPRLRGCRRFVSAVCLRRPYLFSRKRKDRGEKSAWTRLVPPAPEFS